MNVSEIFIRRPVMTILLMAAMVIFGWFGYMNLPVSELPNVDFPTILVSASLPGADPDTMASSVAQPLENQFSTIAGISNMSSSSTQGSTQITIQFDLDKNIDAAAQDVQTAISAASRQLPTQMPSPPTLRKLNPADFPIIYLSMGSPSLPLQQVDKYAETLLARQLSTLDGVAQVNVYGSQKFAVRIQADPAALAARGIGIDQVAAVANAANPNIPTGSLMGPKQTTLIHATGQLTNAADFEQQVVAYRNGAPVRVRDVARVLDSVENKYVASWYRDRRAIVLAIQRQPGSNTIKVVNAIRSILPRFQAQLPASVELNVLYDRSQSIRASVSDVQMTLIIAGILVIAVIFLFLRTLRATIIPSLALPIAVIGTFAGMSFLNYSLDNLSLLALTLSVGFVVDDAIVMLENCVRHVENGEAPFDAALNGAREISFTIVSMTASLAAVFIPLVFMGGIIGRLLHEFAVTIVLVILFSGLVSITLTPLMCSRMLRPEIGRGHNRLYQWSERSFDSMRDAYERSLHWSVAHKFTVFAIFLASVLATVAMFMFSKFDFLPSEDTGQLYAQTEAANGTSFEQMIRYQKQATAIVTKDPNIAGFMSAVGAGGPTSTTNAGRMFINLKPKSERQKRCTFLIFCHALSADDIVQELSPKLQQVPGLRVYLQNPPAIPVGGIRSKSMYQYTLQDLDFSELQTSANRLITALSGAPGFQDVTSDLYLSTPSLTVTIDRDRAGALGVTPQAIETALGAAFGGEQISSIYTSSDTYQVILEVLPRYQQDPTALSRIYVTSNTTTTNANGQIAGNNLVPLTAVTRSVQTSMPLSINHLGQLPSATISFNLAPGYALSDAVSTINRVQRRLNLPPTVQGSFQGTAQAFQSSTSNMGLLLIAALAVVYIVLGILYESFIHPLTILSGLPSAAVGALITLWLFGVPVSLYAFVGMIMLIGIVKKNAIMMIDFALTRQRSENAPAQDAIVEAALIRFRPIMMTTMAALMGTLPIAIGFGQGAETRRPLGLAVVGGLVLSQLLTLYITPVLYVYLDRLGGQVRAWRAGGRPAPRPTPAE